MRQLEALRGECAAIDDTLSRLGSDEWILPALGEWNVAELVAHLIGAMQDISAHLDEPAPEGQPPIDHATYYSYDADEVSPWIARLAHERAERVPAEDLPGMFAAEWRAGVDRASSEPGDRVVVTFRGPMRLDDFLATRVLEAVVHHMDLCAALGVPPVATPDAARLTMALLEGLLGSRRPRNFGRARFIRAATGRLEVDDPRFPILR